MKRFFLCALILSSFFTWAACSRQEPAAPAGQRTGVGKPAPDFKLKDLNGRYVRLSDYRGHVVLIDFWATWCPPCQATIPELVSVEKKYRDKGIVVLGISVDEGADAAKLAAFSKEHKMNYPVLLGSEAVQDVYNVRGIPMIVLVGKEGKIQERYMGYMANFQQIVSAEINRLI